MSDLRSVFNDSDYTDTCIEMVFQVTLATSDLENRDNVKSNVVYGTMSTLDVSLNNMHISVYICTNLSHYSDLLQISGCTVILCLNIYSRFH